MGIVSRLRSLVTRAGEGEPRPGPYWLPLSGGWLSAEAGANWNWWQLGHDIESGGRSAMVEACVNAYSQTVAMCPGDHWWLNNDGGRERITTSALCRILKRPNTYESISDFLLNGVRDLYSDGNAYALALRNDRYEISQLHWMNPKACAAHVAQTGDVFYSLSGNEVVDKMLGVAGGHRMLVPSRDVLHLRLNTTTFDPLRGESPLVAAARDIAAGDAIAAQQFQFYMNQARPSFVLSTDMLLDKDQVDALRQRWDQQSRGMNSGGTPILTAGLKPVPLSQNANDSQLAEVLKISRENIALAYRVPLQLLGLAGTPTGSTEALMQGWVQSSLGFCLNHVEEAIGNLFNLKGYPDEYVEFNTDALLRSLMKDRVEAFARGVQGGIFSPNEARTDFGLPRVKAGDEPRVQSQVVPLSAANAIPTAPTAQSAPASPAALPAPKEPNNVDDEPGPDTRQWARALITTADAIDQRVP
jgi:HK97 family phage portal protein